ncbi:MAG: transposase domain-containing protein [Eubacteriales bacterium]
MYTIVETAKLNNLNVFEYLKYLLEEMPNIDFYNNPELINQYTPWAEELPDRCRMIKK